MRTFAEIYGKTWKYAEICGNIAKYNEIYRYIYENAKICFVKIQETWKKLKCKRLKTEKKLWPSTLVIQLRSKTSRPENIRFRRLPNATMKDEREEFVAQKRRKIGTDSIAAPQDANGMEACFDPTGTIANVPLNDKTKALTVQALTALEWACPSTAT